MKISENSYENFRSTGVCLPLLLRKEARSVLAGLALLAVTVSPVLAGNGNVGNTDIAPPQSSFRGQTYSEWAASYFQWVYSLPFDHHPLYDTADCSTGQSGNVWFIDGTHGTPFPPDGRYCTIPPGTALFLGLAATQWDNESCNAAGTAIQRTDFDESELRDFARLTLNSFLGTRGIVIDGVPVQGLLIVDPATNTLITNPNTPYRVQSPVYDYTIPALNNILILDDGPCYSNPPPADLPDLTVDGAVADGVFVMIKPLTAGAHTIQFGPLNSAGVPTRVYHITVAGH